MRSTSFTVLSALSLITFALASPEMAHRRLHRAVVERQGQGRPDANETSSAQSSSQAQSSSVVVSSASTTTSTIVSSISTTRSESSAIATSSSITSTLSTSSVVASSSEASASPSPSSSAISTSASPLPSGPSVSTISVSATATAVAPSTISTITSVRTVTSSATSVSRSVIPSSAATSSAAADTDTTSSGLSKPALIGSIIAAVVVGLAAIGFTLFRKWKLRPSNRFEKRLNAIDFAPKGGHDDDFFEKSHNRSASASSAERHRKALVAEEFDNTPDLTAGIPEHDFTAGSTYGMAGAGATAGGAAGYGMYNNDPFAHAQSYEYQYGEQEHGYPPQSYDQYGHAVAPAAAYDMPTQDAEHVHGQGYADLQRGPSNGSNQHSHTQHTVHSPTTPQMYHDDMSFPESGAYLGRPTGGSDGP